ncbi:MAG: hypothetical protein ACPG44_08885 [Polaribacter sp.]
MSNKHTAELKLNPNDLLITFNQKLSEFSSAVFFGVNGINNTKELPEAIISDDNPMFEHVPFREMSLEKSKSNFKNWLLKKGFEDIIIALTELLISFSDIIDLNEKVKSKPNGTIDNFYKIIFEPNDENSLRSFPDLIKKVNKSLNSPMRFTEEMETINRIRRCLVHRNGIVRPNDFNNKDKKVIELKWWYFEIYIINDGTEKLFEPPEIITNKTKVKGKEISRIKHFKENEKIEISFQELNELILFCQTIGKDILKKFKLN